MEQNSVNEPILSFGKSYTYADYLNFSYEEMVEIIKGKIFKMSPAPSSKHQKISINLSTILHQNFKGKKCSVFNAPFDVVLPMKGKDFMSSDRVVQPDVVVICDPSKIQDKGCFGAPDWIIEILSPNTIRKDLKDKFDLYEESGVGEYWIIDPQNLTVEVFVLDNEKYNRINVYIEDDIVPSNTFPSLNIDLKEIFD
jgi:Uma2 family endonuclease